MDNKTFNELSLDMTAFNIIRFLSEKDQVFQNLDEEAFVCSSLKNISEFIGLFFKTFPSVDLLAYMVYLLNRMNEKNFSHELEILQQIMDKMISYSEPPISSLNDKQLYSL